MWAGLTLPAVLARIENGTWPGLASFYTRYRHPRTRRKALLADWAKALAYVTAQQARKPTQSLVRNSPTSEPPSHGGAPPDFDQDQQRARGTPAEFQWIRTWWSALGLLEHDRYTDRAGIGKRWVLRAIGEAAMKTGSRYVAFGTRSLSIATGLDHTTVAAHLRALREEDDPLIDLIENDRGLQGDLYQLRIPDEITARAGRVAGGPGSCTRCGRCSGNSGTPPRSSTKPSNTTRAGRNAASTWSPGPGCPGPRCTRRWKPSPRGTSSNPATAAGSSSPGPACRQLAEQFGCADTVRALLNRHRDERARYRRALRIVDQHHIPALSSTEAYLWPPEPPPDEETLLELLERELGAHPIPIGA